MCKKCTDFLMEHFYRGYSPEESLALYRSSHSNKPEMEQHLQDFVAEMLDDPHRLYAVRKKWKREHGKK